MAAAAAHFERAVLAGSKVKYSVILALQQVSWVGWPRDRPTGRHLAELHRAEGKRCSGRRREGGRERGKEGRKEAVRMAGRAYRQS